MIDDQLPVLAEKKIAQARAAARAVEEVLLSISTIGSARRFALSASRVRVASFSRASNSLRAATHCVRETILGRSIAFSFRFQSGLVCRWPRWRSVRATNIALGAMKLASLGVDAARAAAIKATPARHSGHMAVPLCGHAVGGSDEHRGRCSG